MKPRANHINDSWLPLASFDSSTAWTIKNKLCSVALWLRKGIGENTAELAGARQCVLGS